jgi:hypothetical protein
VQNGLVKRAKNRREDGPMPTTICWAALWPRLQDIVQITRSAPRDY